MTIAASIYGIGSALNPINVRIDQPISYETKIENLKIIYGTDNYYNCYADNLNSYGCRQATLASDPYSKDSYFLQCYTYMKFCLEQKAIDSSARSNCATGKVYYNGQCTTPDEGCKLYSGVGAYYTGFNQNTGKYNCACLDGYTMGTSGCVKDNIATSTYSFLYDSNGNYKLKAIPESVARGALDLLKGTATTNEEVKCLKMANTIYHNESCLCNLGYQWNKNNVCEKTPSLISENNNITKQEIASTTVIDKSLSNKMKGKILLQVESRGEAWYINPKTSEKHYLADGNRAYDVMRNLGVGITNKDLEKVQSNKIFAKKNAGKIFLQIESKGEAYYIDFNGVVHYLKDGAAAYEIMRNLGLGVTNDNLNKIPDGSL